MKTFNLFEKQVQCKNEELEKCIVLAIQKGYIVRTFNPSGNIICQIFIDNGKTFGSVSADYSGVKYSTCHKSENGSGNGTGFGMSDDIELCTESGIEKCFVFAPHWAKNTHRIQKETWEQHITRPINQILQYAEIKL